MSGRGNGGRDRAIQGGRTTHRAIVLDPGGTVGGLGGSLSHVEAVVTSTLAARNALEAGDGNCLVVVHGPPAVDVASVVSAVGDWDRQVPVLAVVADDETARAALAAGASDVFRIRGESADPEFLDARIGTLPLPTDPAADGAHEDGSVDLAGDRSGTMLAADDQLTQLIEVTRRLMAAETPAAVLTETSRAAAEVLSFPGTGVRRYDAEEESLISVSLGSTVTEIEGRPTYDVEGTPHGQAFSEGETIVEDVGSDDPYDRDPFVQTMYVPIGDWGILSAGRTDRAFDETDVRLAELLAATSEAALNRAERREALMHYREVLEAVAGMVFALDEHGRFTLVTEPFADQLGYRREQLLDEHVSRVLSAHDTDRAARLYEEILASEMDSAAFEGECETAGGDRFPVEVEVSVLTDENDAFRGAVGLVQDITELRETRKRLREERDRFTYLFDNLPDAVVEVEFVDGEPIARSVNPTFEHLFGYAREEVLGQSLDEFILSGTSDDGGQELNSRAANGEAIQTEVRRQTADGNHHFLLRVVPYDDDGDRSFAIYTDITDQKQREQSLQVINRVLRHNLRNDLNVLAGYAREIASKTDDEAIAEDARYVSDTAENLASLSAKGREIERVFQAGPSDDSPVDLAATAREVVERARERYETATLTCDLPEHVPVDGGDRLRTVVENLVENAVVHNEGEPRVAVTATVDEEWTELRVADDGPGIPVAERAVITEDREITQLNHASGLGLWLVKWIVEGYGGGIEFEESRWGGTTVVVRLPTAVERS